MGSSIRLRRLSPPRENVLLVPNENVLLTRRRWKGGRTRSSHHDPAGQRPAGSAQKGTEEADQTVASGDGIGGVGAAGAAVIESLEAARGQGGDSWFARTGFPAEDWGGEGGEDRGDSLARGLRRFRADAGQRIPGEETRDSDWPGSVAADHDSGRTMGGAPAKGGESAPVAAAPELPRGTGAVGHQRARLAGRPGREAVPDSHDRRRHQRADGEVRAARLDRREHAPAVEVSGASRPAGGVLYRQSQPVPDRAENRTRRKGTAAGGEAAAAANADRARLARTRHCVAAGAFAAGERARGAQFRHGAGPAGE